MPMYCYWSKNKPQSSQLGRPNSRTNNIPTLHKMARNTEPRQRELIVHMICSRKRLTTSQMAKVTKYSERSVTNVRKNMWFMAVPNRPRSP